MISIRIARAAARTGPAAVRLPLQRRGYADAVSDKIKLTLALPHQSIYKSTDVYVLRINGPLKNPNLVAGNVRADLPGRYRVQVNIPAESGEMGVLANHVPSIEQLKPGLVEVIEESGGSKQFFLSGGFAIVQPDSQLSINAVEGFSLEDFSADAVRSQITEAQKIAGGSGSEQDIAEAKIELEASSLTFTILHTQHALRFHQPVMRVRRRRLDNIDVSRQPSGIRNHSNPYSEAMGPLVKEGFVADRIQRLQEARSKLGVLQPLPPKITCPIPEMAQKYDSCSSPEPDRLPRGRAYRTRSFGPVTPDKPPKLLASESSSEKRWIKSSPSTPVIRTPTGAALYWDRKIQSLRHPPTREALEIRRLKRGHRSNENVKQIMSSMPETPSRCQNRQPRSKEHNSYSARSEEHEGPIPLDLIPLQENEVCQPHIHIHKPSIADHMGDIINHIDQALEDRYDTSADLTAEAQVPNSHDPMDDLYGGRDASAQRRLFKESQSTEALTLSDLSGASREKAPSSNVHTSESGSTSSGDELGPSMRDGGLNNKPQGRNRATTKRLLPTSSSDTGCHSPDPVSSPGASPRAWSSHHSDPLENMHPSPAKLRSPAINHVLACIASTETAISPEDLEPLEPKTSERSQPIPEEPESVQPNINDRHQSIYEVPASLNRQSFRTDRKASLSSIRSTSSQGSKKWRWWKLALVDKQPKAQVPRKRQSSPNHSGLNVRIRKQGEGENEGMTSHLPVETILETEVEGEHTSIDEMLDGSPAHGAPSLHSPTVAEVQTRRSSQWVEALPSPGPTVSAAQAPSRPSSPRASVVREANKRDQRITKVQVIVSLDGASDLVVEASLETKRRKSFS